MSKDPGLASGSIFKGFKNTARAPRDKSTQLMGKNTTNGDSEAVRKNAPETGQEAGPGPRYA